MLILTRRPREVVMVGDDVQIMVLDIAGDRVRLGITAPREIQVRRQDIKPSQTPSASLTHARPIP
jgi:carbon storage regulator